MTGTLLSLTKDLRTHASNTGGWHGLYTDAGFAGLAGGSDVFASLDGLSTFMPSRILTGIKQRVGWLIMTDTDLQTQYQQALGSFSGLTLSPHSTSSHMIAMRNDKWKTDETNATLRAHELMHCISDEYILWGGTGTTLDKSEPFWTPWLKIDAAVVAGTLVRASQYGWSTYSEFMAVTYQNYVGYTYNVGIGNSGTASTYLSLRNNLWPTSAGITQTERDAAWVFFDTLTVPTTLPPLPPGYTLLQ